MIQSTTPISVRSNNNLLRDLVSGPRVFVKGPRIISANGEALPQQKRPAFRKIQNCGTVAVKFLIDNANNCTELNFHGILAPGSAQDDGFGAQGDFSQFDGRVSIYGVGGGTPRVCVIEGVAPEGL